MGSYSSAPCLVTYYTGISYKFSALQKPPVCRSTLPASTFLFIGIVLIKAQAETILLLSLMPLRNQGLVSPTLSLVSENPPATLHHLGCAFLSHFPGPADTTDSAVSRSNCTRLDLAAQATPAISLGL